MPQNAKQTTFTFLEVLMRAENVALFSVRLFLFGQLKFACEFVFFLRSKSFPKNKIEIVLITSHIVLLKHTLSNTILGIYLHMLMFMTIYRSFFSIIVCQNLFLPVSIHYLCLLFVRIYFHLYAFNVKTLKVLIFLLLKTL